MADTVAMLPAASTVHRDDPQMDSILDDFNYSTNVAGSSKYIRLGYVRDVSSGVPEPALLRPVLFSVTITSVSLSLTSMSVLILRIEHVGFLRKVYGILSLQLLLTAAVSAVVISNEVTRSFMRNNPAVLFISAITSFVLIFALMVKSRETPLNYILLTLFTFAESFLIATVVSCYDVSVVIEAFVLTFAVTIGLTVYTFQSKRDMSGWGAGLFACLWVLIISGIMQIFIQSILFDRMIATFGALLFSLFIVYDTHMIMHKVNPEDYIHASIMLYLDIINLFLQLLRLLGDKR